MIKPLDVPIIPNSPLSSKNTKIYLAKILLRKNRFTGLVENSLFNLKKIKYDDNYQNDQSNSQQFKIHMMKMLEILKRNFSKNSKLVEVGCGKGEFLTLVKKQKYFKYQGYDATYQGNDKKIFKRYLNKDEKIQADIVVIRHVLEHIKKPHSFLKEIKNIFGDTNVFIEVPNYDWIIKNNAFYDITYEHVNYFNKKSLSSIFNNKFKLRGLCFNNQYQYFLGNLKNISRDFEIKYRNDRYWKYLDFYKLFPKIKSTLKNIEIISSKYKNIYVWGAATKGCMFIAHCYNNNKLKKKIKNAIDINKFKCNKYLPISKVKIIHKEDYMNIANIKNDLLIISNPNYKKEIIKELKKNSLNKIKILCL
jgi:hypothetical protein